MIVTPPRLVGTRTVCDFFGHRKPWVYRRLADGPMPGYVGKIGGRHTWNMSELVASTFGSQASIELVVDALSERRPADPVDLVLCAVADCDDWADVLGLCPDHLGRLFTAFRRAASSTVVTLQLVAMCRWVVERNAHIALPDFDPWGNVCMTPGCEKATNVRGHNGWHGPLCPDCTASLWQYKPSRPHPAHWKKSGRRVA